MWVTVTYFVVYKRRKKPDYYLYVCGLEKTFQLIATSQTSYVGNLQIGAYILDEKQTTF